MRDAVEVGVQRVLDTNLFIRAFRDRAANAELQRFHQVFAPFEFLSAVVAQELRAVPGRPPRAVCWSGTCWPHSFAGTAW